MPDARAPLKPARLKTLILHHLRMTVGRDPNQASRRDWRMALSLAIREQMVAAWLDANDAAQTAGSKRVYYLSMEFLIGRLLGDALENLRVTDAAGIALRKLGVSLSDLLDDEPDAALGNGGLGRLAACFLESMSTLHCPATGYGLRFEHGLFRQSMTNGAQVETPEDWLVDPNVWEVPRPETVYQIGFGGHVGSDGIWYPAQRMQARAYDTPVVGWQGSWANTLRLWEARPTKVLDLALFNAGDHTNAAHTEAQARALSRVLYPDDGSDAGKDLRLKQEFLLASASLQDILHQFRKEETRWERLPDRVALQLNDTHPAIAGPELMRLLVDVHGVVWSQAKELTTEVCHYTNHTLLPEALETWSTWAIGNTLPRHMQIIERLDGEHAAANPSRPANVGMVRDDAVRMGDVAFIMARRVNGVSALHSDLMTKTVFSDLHKLHPEKILNQTNGVTPRRWIRLANPGLSGLLTEALGEGWSNDLGRLTGLEPLAKDAVFQRKFMRVKRANKVALSNWCQTELGIAADPDAMFDIQIKRIHEYKRQLMNVFDVIGLWSRMRAEPERDWTPRVRIFAGKAAPGYVLAKDIIRLITAVADRVNNDPLMRGRLKVIFAPNYNVSLAERLIPAADLSEQISTAGKEASGTGNMKFTMNGALTIGTLDGANVEIREAVGAENFFLFGLTAQEAQDRMSIPGHARSAIEASPMLQNVLQLIVEGQFAPDELGRFNNIVNRTWHDDPFLVAADFDAYAACQDEVAKIYGSDDWTRMSILNVARSGMFSSDRTIQGYMRDIWRLSPIP